jgi:hypothetical protein
MMHANGARLGTPFGDAFLSIQDFAGEILRKRQTLRERKRANADRARVAEGMAARIERSIALEYASNLANKVCFSLLNLLRRLIFMLQSPVSPNDDVVSIPSGSDESGAEEPPRVSKVRISCFRR